jgi:type I restriction enzyme S subunit
VRAGWIEKTLGETCNIARGGSPRPIQTFLTNDPDGINWVKISDATASGKYIYETSEKIKPTGAARSRIVNDGDFLLSNSMSFGRPYIMRTTGCVHDGWLVLSGYQKSFNQDFLYHLLGSPQVFSQFDRLAAGSTVRNLNIELASKVIVPIPSLEEQHRIVALLDEAFADIATAKANAEKNLQNARELFTRISGSVLAQYASTSQSITLENLVEPDCSLSYGIVQPGDEVPEGLHIVRPVDMNTDVVMLEGLKKIDPALANSYARTTLKGNDILLCVRGTTGTVALAHSELAGANVTRGIVPIRFAPEKISHQFGYYLLRSEPAQLQIQAKTYGTALQQINIRDLRQLTLPVPAPQDQEIIVQRLSALEEETKQLTATYANKLTALDDLKKSLLHQAFSGQL